MKGVYILRFKKYYYIGSSKKIDKRINTHLKKLNGNKHKNNFAQNVFNKYGITSISYIKIEEYKNFEKFMIKRHIGDPKCVNILNSSTGGDTITHHPDRDKICKVMSEKAKNRPPITEETRKKLSKARKNRKLSVEECRKISERMKNRHISDETKRRMSESAKKRCANPEWLKNHREKMYGNTPWNKGKKLHYEVWNKGLRLGKMRTHKYKTYDILVKSSRQVLKEVGSKNLESIENLSRKNYYTLLRKGEHLDYKIIMCHFSYTYVKPFKLK